MTIEELKELAERIDRNNRQLTADITAMKQDCASKETREALTANVEKYQQEIIKALSCIPEDVNTTLSYLFGQNDDNHYSYKRFYSSLNGDVLFVRKDGIWCIEWTNKEPTTANLTNFIVEYRKVKEKVLNDVADLLKKTNDLKLFEAKDVVRNANVIKAASNQEEI